MARSLAEHRRPSGVEKAQYQIERNRAMYGWAFTLAIIALIAAVLGFGGVAGTLANIAIVIFVLALIGTLIFLMLGWKAAKTVGRNL